jgi:putative transposase
VFTVVIQHGSARQVAAGLPAVIDEVVRDGARRMLAAALEAEVAADVGRFAGDRDEAGYRFVVRNGRAVPRQVLTAAGAVEGARSAGERRERW